LGGEKISKIPGEGRGGRFAMGGDLFTEGKKKTIVKKPKLLRVRRWRRRGKNRREGGWKRRGEGYEKGKSGDRGVARCRWQMVVKGSRTELSKGKRTQRNGS